MNCDSIILETIGSNGHNNSHMDFKTDKKDTIEAF